jgi:hypothetical protein
MAVSLIKAPDTFSFSRNFITVKFSCDNYLEQPGVAAVNEVAFQGMPVSGTVSITWGSTTVVMSAVASPDDSGTQFPTGDGFAAYVASILPYFQANYKLSSDFDITAVGLNLIFTAKKKNHGYGFNAFNSSIYSTSVKTAGVPEVPRANFAVVLQLFCEKEDYTGFELIRETRLPVKYGTSGVCEDDVAEVLNSYIQKSGIDIPDSGSLVPLVCKKTARKFYFRYGESWGADISVKTLHTSASYTVIEGGLSYVGSYLNNLKSYIVPDNANPSKDRFLRQGNNQVYTRSNQPQFLYFFNTRATQANAVLKKKVLFTDGTAPLVSSSAAFNLEQYRKYAFNVRFDQLIVSEKVVQRYEVWLEAANGTVLSETRTFWIDYELKQYVRYFLNWSSWGALDSRVCYGKGTSESEINQQEAKRIRKPGYDIKAGDSTVFDVKQTSSFKVSTGFISRNALVLNRDFYTSAKKFRYVKGLMLPIKLTSKQIPELRDGSNLYYQEFEYQYLFDDDAYTEGDVEEPGISFDGFFFNSANPLVHSSGLAETDPTVPSWVKSITTADITRWNASSSIDGYLPLTGGTLTGSLYGTKIKASDFLALPTSFDTAEAEAGEFCIYISDDGTAHPGETPPPSGTVDLSNYYNRSDIDSILAGNTAKAGYNKSTWDDAATKALAAYGWGNHASAGYYTSAQANSALANYLPLTGGTLSGTLNGPAVNANKLKATAYLVLPGAFSSASAAADEWNLYIDDTSGGVGSSAPAAVTNLASLTDVALSGLLNGQLLRYDSAAGKWKNWTPDFVSSLADLGKQYYTSNPLFIYRNGGSFNASVTTPTVALAIGDYDTGFHWEGDGDLAYYSNGTQRFKLNNLLHSANASLQAVTDIGNNTNRAIRITGESGLSGGPGLELYYHSSGVASILAYDRNTGQFKNLNIESARTYFAKGEIEVNGGSANAKLGIKTAWAGIEYPTLYGTAGDEWIMIHAPHIPFLTTSTGGARVRYASDSAASHYWDAGIFKNETDTFAIGRDGVKYFTIGADGKAYHASDIYASGWFRAHQNNGLYFQDWGGGLHMVDNTSIRTYGQKNFYCDRKVEATSLQANNYFSPPDIAPQVASMDVNRWYLYITD